MNSGSGDNVNQIHITFQIQTAKPNSQVIFFALLFRFVNQGKHLFASRKKSRELIQLQFNTYKLMAMKTDERRKKKPNTTRKKRVTAFYCVNLNMISVCFLLSESYMTNGMAVPIK